MTDIQKKILSFFLKRHLDGIPAPSLLELSIKFDRSQSGVKKIIESLVELGYLTKSDDKYRHYRVSRLTLTTYKKGSSV